MIISILVNVTPVQNFLVRQVSNRLSKQLHTPVEIDHVKFKLFNRFLVEGTYIADEQGDTLLYAKELAVNVTNFFFLKNRTVLYYLGMKDVHVHLRRAPGDSLWNYQFLIDAFAKPGNKKDKPLPNIGFRNIDLEDIRIDQIDGWKGKNMHVAADAIQLDARTVDLRKHTLAVQNITLDHPLFVLEKYQQTEPPDTSLDLPDSPAAPAADSGSLRWNTGRWHISADHIKIKEGGFALMDQAQKTLKTYFDPKHIAFFDINGSLDNVHFDKDSIISRLDLTARERCGLRVDQLKGRFKISPVTIEVADMDLITNKSHLKDYFALQFDAFSDLSDFVTRVTMRGHFTDAVVSSDDIGFFAPPLLKWKKDIQVDGLAYGTLDQLTGEDMHIKAGESTTLSGNISMSGLPDINNTFIDFQTDELVTTGKDVQQFIPALKESQKINLDSLTYLKFSGSYVGFIYDFVSYGTFSTNLGTIRSDLNLKFGPRHKVPFYSGSLSSGGFELGTFLRARNVGNIAFKTKVNGSGFSLDAVDANVEGQIDQLTFKGYDYHHIELQGDLHKKLFQGQVAINDSNLVLDFRGDIDFNDSIPRFNFQSDVSKSDLRALHLTRDSINFSGKLNLDFKGNNLNTFLGTARLYDIHLFKNQMRVAFDTLAVHAYNDSSGGKWLTLQGNEINGYVHGHYDLTRLPDAALLFLNNYFPNKIKPPREKDIKEQFAFSLQFGNIDSLLHSFIPHISSLNSGTLSGRINTLTDSLELMVNVDHAGYKFYRFNDLRLQAVGTLSSLHTQNRIGQIFLKDSLILPETTIETASRKDTSLISLQTVGSTALNKANLKARLLTLADGYALQILNSALYINDKDWHVTPDNLIELRKKEITIHNFNIYHDNQRISLHSIDTASRKNAFLVQLSHLYIGDFSQFFLPQVSLEGIADGEFHVADPLTALKVSGQLTASEVSMNGQPIGQVNASASYMEEKEALQWKIQQTAPEENNFTMEGLLGVGDNPAIAGDFQLNHTNISILNAFVDGYVSDLKGYATGRLQLSGDKSDPEIIGSVKLDDVDFLVDYTQVRYALTNETIQFQPGKIDLGSITLKDQAGRTGILSGNITHRHFDDIHFDLNVNTQALQFLHTTLENNGMYYGDVIASGRVDFSGPLRDMQMVINATPTKGTHIFLPLSDKEDIGKHDFILFKQYGKELQEQQNEKKEVNLTVKLYANMNPQAEIDVIVDANSGDHITARGNGALQINVNLKGGFQMFGNYSITEGNYIFSFKGLLSREFAINQGSTIAWNGDPSDANINITAIYQVPGGANLYNLIAGEASATVGLTKDDRRLLRQRERIDVYLFLKNSLLHPDISYDIRIPEASISASSLAMTKLQQIRQNPNILINQVAALLAAGQFIPVNSGNASTGILKASGISSAGQWVSSQLTGVLNNLFGNQLNDLGLSFSMNYNAYSASGNYGDIQRNDVQFNLSKNLFNNRVELEVGPSINWGRSNTPQASNSSYFAGDFRLEYLITPDGRVRFIAFSRSNYNVLLNQNLTRAGIGISYSRSFDNIHELLRSRREKERLDSIRNARYQKYLQETQEEEAPFVPAPAPTDTTQLQRPPAIKEED